MSFDYDKVKAKQEDAHGNSWTAYSDLFMMLSTVFLLLYVSVGLRSQTSGVAVHEKIKQLTQKNADLEQQLQVYNTLREQHMKNEATEEEAQVYDKLMNKLTLLQDEAKDEKNRLRQAAKENEEKEYALNEYQRLIRNIINTNVLSKTQLAKKDVIIAKKDTINEEQRQMIEEQEEEINANREKIAQTEKDLKNKIRALREARENEEISKSQMEKRIAALKEKSQETIEALERKNQKALQKFAQQEAKIKADFEAQLAQEKLSVAEREKRMAEFEAEASAREAALKGKVSALGSKVSELGSKVAQVEAEKGRALASVDSLQKDLKRAQELANARKELAKRINSELKRAGLSGSVDEKTGDVTLAFGEEYFDAGSSKLKPSMETTLKKFMPGYSSSLFKDPKIANNIENVEIVGFASSTYKGRYVPPDSLDPKDREAIEYNMKLSSQRANAIFSHIVDTKKMSFEHQKDLLPKIKVVGRGYLPEGTSGKDLPKNMTQKEFCARFNCNQAQKVVIKFKLKD